MLDYIQQVRDGGGPDDGILGYDGIRVTRLRTRLLRAAQTTQPAKLVLADNRTWRCFNCVRIRHCDTAGSDFIVVIVKIFTCKFNKISKSKNDLADISRQQGRFD